MSLPGAQNLQSPQSRSLLRALYQDLDRARLSLEAVADRVPALRDSFLETRDHVLRALGRLESNGARKEKCGQCGGTFLANFDHHGKPGTGEVPLCDECWYNESQREGSW